MPSLDPLPPVSAVGVRTPDGERFTQVAPRVRAGCLGHLLRRAGGDDAATLFPALGTKIDHPVGRFDHVEVVLDHEQAMAGLQQLPERGEQLGDVIEMQAGRRLVEDVEDSVPGVRGEVRRNLDALRLAA